jgi:hypothetical protein
MTSSDSKNAGSSLPLIDSHLHFVDFLQDTDIHALLDRMDEAGIVRAVLFGMQFVVTRIANCNEVEQHLVEHALVTQVMDLRCGSFAAPFTETVRARELLRASLAKRRSQGILGSSARSRRGGRAPRPNVMRCQKSPCHATPAARIIVGIPAVFSASSPSR